MFAARVLETFFLYHKKLNRQFITVKQRGAQFIFLHFAVAKWNQTKLSHYTNPTHPKDSCFPHTQCTSEDFPQFIIFPSYVLGETSTRLWVIFLWKEMRKKSNHVGWHGARGDIHIHRRRNNELFRASLTTSWCSLARKPTAWSSAVERKIEKP